MTSGVCPGDSKEQEYFVYTGDETNADKEWVLGVGDGEKGEEVGELDFMGNNLY